MCFVDLAQVRTHLEGADQGLVSLYCFYACSPEKEEGLYSAVPCYCGVHIHPQEKVDIFLDLELESPKVCSSSAYFCHFGELFRFRTREVGPLEFPGPSKPASHLSAGVAGLASSLSYPCAPVAVDLEFFPLGGS